MAKYVWCPEQEKVVPYEEAKPIEKIYIIDDKLDRNKGDYVYNPTDQMYYSSKSKLRKKMKEAGYYCVGNDYNLDKIKNTDFRKPLQVDYKKSWERIKNKNGW